MPLTARPRAFSQQALKRLEVVSTGRSASKLHPLTSKLLGLHGQSYLLPTLTLPKVNGKDAARDLQQLFQIRANNRPTPVVLDLHEVSSNSGARMSTFILQLFLESFALSFSLRVWFNLLKYRLVSDYNYSCCNWYVNYSGSPHSHAIEKHELRDTIAQLQVSDILASMYEF